MSQATSSFDAFAALPAALDPLLSDASRPAPKKPRISSLFPCLLSRSAELEERLANFSFFKTSAFVLEIKPTPPPPEQRTAAEDPPAGLSRLIAWLAGFFAEEKLPDAEELSVGELKIALAIFKRKFRVKDSLTPEKREELLQEIRSVIEVNRAKCGKRTEEKNKFVFKHTVKLLKAGLPSLQARQFSVQEANSLLLKKYALPKDALNHGSLSLQRLRSIFANKKFTEDFLGLLAEPSMDKSAFVRLYQDSVPRKLLKILKKWNKNGDGSDDAPENFERIIEYFQANNQCKLPWTKPEMFSAISCFISSIQESPNDKLN